MAPEDIDPYKNTAKDVRKALSTAGSAATVATVAAVEGSAYRRPGAKMVVTAEGVNTGAVTAGCLEPSVVDICETVRRTGQPRPERFDLTGTGETWGLGLGCNGVIDVFVEPRDESWDVVLEAVAEGVPIAVVTIIESDADTTVGDRVILSDSGVRTVPDRDPVPLAHLNRAEDTVERVIGTGQAATVAAGDATLLVDGFAPIPELLLFGSQKDLGPVARLGSQMGFRVSVHAQRAGIDDATFPGADAVRTGHPTTVAERADEHTYAVAMSHNLVDDRLAVKALLEETAVPYVGVMGPRKRFERLRDKLTLTAGQLDRVAAPVGLDLGGNSPTEIALSIISEVVAVHNGRDGERLSDRTGSIHPTEPNR